MTKSISRQPVNSLLSIIFCFFIAAAALPLNANAASLSGSRINAAANIDLSANSPADWIHWGYVPLELDRKAGVTQQISDYTHVAGADPGATELVSSAYSWTDGIAPGGNISNTRSGERVFQVGKGFQFTVPANTTLKTLRVYVGASNATGQLTATLSDGSAAAYNVSVAQNSGRTSREISLNFRANSGGQTLTVKYVVSNNTGTGSFVTLESAALNAVGGGGAATLTGSMTTVTSINLTSKGPTDWIHWGRISDTPWDRKAGITPLLSNQTTVGLDVSPTPIDTDSTYSWNDGQPTAAVSTRTGLRVFDINKGFRITAPAGTSARTLKVYVGMNNATNAKFTASLSDGSAPDYISNVSQTGGRNTLEFALNYSAASSGKQLVVTFVRSNARTTGTWITLESAKLLGAGGGGGGGGTQPPSTAPTGVTASDDTFTNKVAVSWASVTGATFYEVYRSTAAGVNGSLRSSPAGTSYDDTNATAGTDYYYSVKACNSAGCSGFSAQDPGRRAVSVVVPAIPTGIAASDDTFTTKIAVSWNAVSGASSYEVYRSTTLGVTGTLFSSPAVNSVDDATAVAGTSYYYTIKSCNSAGCSGLSTQDVGSRAIDSGGGTAPANPPTNRTASVDTFTDKVTIGWASVAGSTYNELWRSTTSGLKGIQIGLPAGSSFDDTTATPGTDYWYGLKACNDTGCSNFSGQVMGRRAIASAPPAAPVNVSASDDTFLNRVAVTWGAVTDAINYQVYRSTSAGTNGSLLASPTGSSYDDTGAATGTTYYYSVKACNDAGCSAFSTQDQGSRPAAATPPAIPTNVTASDDTFTTKIAVSWNTVTNANSYQVYRSTVSGTTGTLINSPAGTSYDDTGAIAGTSYYYSVKACNTDGCSNVSVQDTGSRAVGGGITLPANPPKNISASVDSFNDKVSVNWGSVVGASYYELWRSETVDLKGIQIDLPTTTNFNDTTATPGTDYWYGLKACNSAGCSTFSSQAMGRMAVAPPPIVPGIPVNVVATVDTFTTKVGVSWNSVTDATFYQIYRSDTSGVNGTLLASPVSTSYDDTNAVAGTSYYYSIKACNVAGCSLFSTQDGGSRAVPPVTPTFDVTAPDDITIAATGFLTVVNLGEADAVDSVDGNLIATPDKMGPFKTGRHIITWSAKNSAEVTATAQQIVDVQPLVDLQLDQFIGEGGSVTVSVFLSGPAAIYPVTIPYAVEGTAQNPQDHNAASTNLVINSGTSTQISFNVINDAENDAGETIVFNLGTPVNAAKGINTSHTATIVEENLPPQVQLMSSQAGVVSNWVVSDAGDVTISATVNDPNPSDTHLYDWSQTNNALVPIGTSTTTFTFDPSDLAEGYYLVKLTVTENGLTSLSTSVELLLRVDTSRPGLSSSSDDDKDGIDNAAEGYGDSDGDGIADYLDPINNPSLLPGNTADSNTFLLQVSPGLSMKLGQTAMSSNLITAVISQQNLEKNGGSGGTAGQNTSDDSYTYPVGIFDFEIGNLPVIGQSVAIVIPVLEAIPEGATYRKYFSDTGWQDFVEDAKNKIDSAPGTPGVCPPPGDNAYTPGLGAGYFCIQITIEDGGSNDTDRSANGTIRDPGAVAESISQNLNPINNSAQSSGDGGGCVYNPDARFDLTFYILLFVSLVYIGFSRRKS